MSFVHLHVHSMYSLLDGFSSIKKLVERTVQMEMPAIALTDHGAMFGAIEFYDTARNAGIKPIIGLEIYLAARGMSDRDAQLDKRSSHLILLAENGAGYHNLLQIASAAQLEGFYYNPRIDHDFLASHSDGLIASTACMSGEVARAFLAEDRALAQKKLEWYFNVFGADRFFLELQRHDMDDLERVNQFLLEAGKYFNARYIATNDVHYIDREDAHLQDILLAIQTGTLLSDGERFHMDNETYYLRSPQEMALLFHDLPEAITNTLAIAERCEVDLTKREPRLPKFTVPEGNTAQSFLRQLCEEGFLRRYKERSNYPEIRERLEYELRIIHQMGFDSYFLIVWDICRYAREQGIWYNARGSAAGSMVAYTLDITLVEPVEHGLIFERFLNPDRTNLPDIDLDFQDDRRSQVMEYCAQKYGSDKIAQIITFGTLGARAAIRDVGRVMDISLTEVDRVCKTIPNIPGKPITIHEALEKIPELKNLYNEAEYLKVLIDTAERMEGVVRNAGTHAAGVVISDKPVIEYCPLHRPTSGSEESPIKTVTQFEMSIVDALGLLKIDFLGLSSLTVMARACELIRERHGVSLNLENIPLEDPETFKFLGEGHTAGVFQLEGSGMTRYLMQMKPQNLDHIIAMVALFRPGPMDFIPDYIQRMHGLQDVSYRHPALERVFGETYGIPIYQEQIMTAAIELAGYSPSEADDLRKAIAKKKAESLLEHHEKFIQGAVEHGIDEITAAQIFKEWEKFARYGFNKSHAADYGVIAVETAYLKTHYTVEYMTALLSASKNDSKKVAFYVNDCRLMGIDLQPPDINLSEYDFSIEEQPDQRPDIRFGLGAIKNVGSAPVCMILEARSKGAFKDLNDFARRVDLRLVGKRAIESLIRVGAMDRFAPRDVLDASMDRIIAMSAAHFRAAQSGQLTFFGEEGGMEIELDGSSATIQDRRVHLEWERELLGLYVSDHPLAPYIPNMRSRVTHTSIQLGEAINNETVCVGGVVSRFHQFNTRNGQLMGFVTLDDMHGNIELVIFAKAWEKFNHLVSIDQVITAMGKVDLRNGDPKVKVDSIELVTLDSDAETWEGPFSPDPDEAVLFDEDYDSGFTSGGWTQPSGDSDESDESSYSSIIPEENEDAPTIPEKQNDEPTQSDETGQLSFMEEQPGLIQTRGKGEKLSIPPYLTSSHATVGKLADANQPRMLRVVLKSNGEKERDCRRLRSIYGVLNSTPGSDRFSFLVYEQEQHYLIEFPNESTGISNDLVQRLSDMVGIDNVIIEPLQPQ